MVKEFINANDLSMRLNNCFVFYKGEPYYTRIGTYPYLELYKIVQPPGYEPIVVKYTDPELNTKSPSLGYMNFKNNAIYLKRYPSRRQNLGLRPGDIVTNPRIYGSFTSTKEFYNVLTGKYPTYKKTMENIFLGKVLSMAVDRDFCISKGDRDLISLLFKERVIGYYEYLSEKFRLLPVADSSWLTKLIYNRRIIPV